MNIDPLYYWIGLFFSISYLVAFYIKRKGFGSNHFLFISMIRTKKPIKYFEYFAHHKKILNLISDLGIVLGFGLIGFDYLYAKNYSKSKRILCDILLFAFFYLAFSFIFFPLILSTPISAGFAEFFSLGFGIFGFAGFVISGLIFQAIDILIKTSQGVQACPGIAPVIPGVQIPNVPVFIPVHAWISLLIILIIHEGMHGVLARKAKVKVKNTGLLLFGFLPIGAFVEPDDKSLLKAPKREQLRIFSAGATGNLMVFLLTLPIFLIIFALLVNPFVAPRFEELSREGSEGLYIIGVEQFSDFCGNKFENSAFRILSEGDKILEVNGKEIITVADYYRALTPDSNNFLMKYLTSSGEIKENSFERNSLGRIGISIEQKTKEGFEIPFNDFLLGAVYNFLVSFIWWFILLNLLVFLTNFLPMEPFDGGKIARIIFPEYLSWTGLTLQQREALVSGFFFFSILVLFFLNALPLLITFN
ncbi:MAG TPA: site-2 protease family protein [archaeon]|nr:site-2 protease family protein [archaeon]